MRCRSRRLHRRGERRRAGNSRRVGVSARVVFVEEVQIVTSQGTELWVRILAEAVRNAAGKITKLQGAVQDIHHRIVVQRQADPLAARLAFTLESISEGFVLVDGNGVFSFVSDRATRLLQRSREELLGKVAWEVFADAVQQEAHLIYLRAMEIGEAAEFEFYFPPLAAWFDARAYPSQEGLAVYFRDVTERRIAQERLRESNERFRIVARATADVIGDWDLVHSTLWWNDGMEAQFGYLPSELEPGRESWTNRIHPDDHDRVVHGIDAAVARRDEYWQEQYRFMRKDGRVLNVVDRGYLIFAESGEPIRFVGGMTDITQRRRGSASTISCTPRSASVRPRPSPSHSR